MKFYLLESHHLASFDQIPAALIDVHHRFLQAGYDQHNRQSEKQLLVTGE